MKVVHTELFDDGSAWSAVVEVEGILYVASFVNNQMNVRLGPYKHNPRRPRWHQKAVTDWAEKQVSSLPAEWHEKHKQMYGV